MQFITGTRQRFFKLFDEFCIFFLSRVPPPGIWCARRWRLLMDSFNQKLTRKYKEKRVGTGPCPVRARTRGPPPLFTRVCRPHAVVWPAALSAHLIITVRLGPKRFEGYFENLDIIRLVCVCAGFPPRNVKSHINASDQIRPTDNVIICVHAHNNVVNIILW